MILACPLCQTRYLVPASLFAAGPRQVRCARCSHSWQAQTPKEMDVIFVPNKADEPPPPHKTPPPIPPGSNLPALPRNTSAALLKKVVGAFLAGLIALLLLWLIVDRQNIVESEPFMASVYDTIGLHVYSPGEGLKLVDIRSELKYEDGIMRLIVEGKIVNVSDVVQTVPSMNAAAVGPDGDTLQNWQIDPPVSTLDPQGETAFQSGINAPKGTVVNVNLNFIEPKNDSP